MRWDGGGEGWDGGMMGWDGMDRMLKKVSPAKCQRKQCQHEFQQGVCACKERVSVYRSERMCACRREGVCECRREGNGKERV